MTDQRVDTTRLQRFARAYCETAVFYAALWGLAEVLYGSAGKAHTIAQCIGYFNNAGFAKVSDEVFVAGTLHRVMGIKAG